MTSESTLVAGLDIGRHHDRTALVVLDGPVVNEAHLMGGTRLMEQAAGLVPLILRTRLTLADETGLGLGLVEALQDKGLPVIGVTIGSGAEPAIIARGKSRPSVYVGKHYIMENLMLAVNGRRLTVAPWLCHGAELREELLQMGAGHTRRGHVTYGARRGHDDLVLALALGVLAGELVERFDAR